MEDWTVRLMESWAELDCAEAVGVVAKDNTAAASMLKITPDVILTFIAADDPIRFRAARLHLSPAQRSFTYLSARLSGPYTVLWANALVVFRYAHCWRDQDFEQGYGSHQVTGEATRFN